MGVTSPVTVDARSSVWRQNEPVTSTGTLRRTAPPLVLLAFFSNAPARGADGGAPPSAGAGPTGVLCLRRLPAPIQFATEGKGSSWLDYEDSGEARARRMAERPKLAVTVDERPAVIVDQKRGGCVDGLALDGKHVARASRPGGRSQAAHFSFANGPGGGNVLELRYEPLYGNVHIEPPRTRSASAILAATCAICPDASDGATERDLGRVRSHHERVAVPAGGLRLRFQADTAPNWRRTMVLISASAPPLAGAPVVNMVLRDSNGRSESSERDCFEANVSGPPWPTCTAEAGTGWDDSLPRDVFVLIERASARRSTTVDLKIVVTDPYDRR
jgi:hypothetical protein